MAITDSIAIALISSVAFTALFFAWNAYKLTQTNDTSHESIGIFLLLMSFIHTIILGSITSTIAKQNSVSAGVVTGLEYNYMAIIIVFVIVTIYFVLRVMILPMLAANKQKKFKLQEE